MFFCGFDTTVILSTEVCSWRGWANFLNANSFELKLDLQCFSAKCLTGNRPYRKFWPGVENIHSHSVMWDRCCCLHVSEQKPGLDVPLHCIKFRHRHTLDTEEHLSDVMLKLQMGNVKIIIGEETLCVLHYVKTKFDIWYFTNNHRYSNINQNWNLKDYNFICK